MRLLLNSALLSFAQLSEKLLSFVVIIIASRYLDPEGVGEFFYYFSLVSLFIPLIDLGFDKLLLQKWFTQSEVERRESFTTMIVLKVILAVPTLAVV